MCYLFTHLQHAADRIEQPPVRVDLLLVLRLDNQDDLNGHEVIGVLSMRDDKLGRGVHGKLGCVLQRMSAAVT